MKGNGVFLQFRGVFEDGVDDFAEFVLVQEAGLVFVEVLDEIVEYPVITCKTAIRRRKNTKATDEC